MKKIFLHSWKRRSSPTSFIRVGDAGVATEVVGHFPAPVQLSGHKHSGPSVYPYIMFPDLSVFKNTSNSTITTLMSAPHLITIICSQTPIRMEVTAHGRARVLPVRIEILPVCRSGLSERQQFDQILPITLAQVSLEMSLSHCKNLQAGKRLITLVKCIVNEPARKLSIP